ncbi:ATP-binding protein [Brevibacillus sp. B_LB10_24]|uniref:ATP-binding protein n=1 Tax=Brevibacillus sp. B_LB10_24 TaxID=3380645 RepID=UPI0038BD0F8D
MGWVSKMTLRSKINWLVALNILFVLILTISALFYMMVQNTFAAKGELALAEAKTIAGMQEIVEAFQSPNPAQLIQPIAEELRKKTGAEFVVVANMDTIRYSHPNPEEIGKRMVGGDNGAVLNKQESITEARGTLGFSVRGKAPVFNREGQQIGVVSVGFMVEDVWEQLYISLAKIGAIGACALLVGLLGAYLLSGHIKKQIFNMEPYEIAFVTQEQAAILDAIREGIIAVNREGKIVTCNREAKKMLEMEDADLIGKNLMEVLPASRMSEVIESGIPQSDQPIMVGNTLAIANRVPVTLSGQVIGVVATFRDKMQLEQIDQRLADIGRYVDTLRSQRHEFMNKLHLISGLIKISEYDMAKSVIERVNEDQQDALQFYLARIRDSAIVGILIGKTHRAGELGIQLVIDPDSYISDRCPWREVVVTVLGNTIENAFEAIQGAAHKKSPPTVSVLIKEEARQLVLHVRDNGPGIDQHLRDRLFEDGSTTKGEGRGFGLAFVSKLISNSGGKITFDTSEEGTFFRITLPIRRSA